MIDQLLNHYQMTGYYQNFPGFTGKLSLLLSLMIVADGKIKNDGNLLLGLIALQLLVGCYMSLGAGPLGVMVLGVGSLVLAGICFKVSLNEKVEWRILPDRDNGLALILVLLAYGVALTFPFFPARTTMGQWLGSPAAVLPHQTVLVLLILLSLRGPAAHAMMVVTVSVVASLIGIMDVIAGTWITGIWLLLGAVVVQCSARGVFGEMPLLKPGDEEVVEAVPRMKPRVAVTKPAPKVTERKAKAALPSPAKKEKKRKWDVK